MIETNLGEVYKSLLVMPAVRTINFHSRIHPNFLTFVAAFLRVVAALLVIQNLSWQAVGLLLISGYLDSLDGELARFQGSASRTGAMLDIVGDRVVEFSIIIALFSVEPSVRGYACMWMLGSSFLCVTSFLMVAVFIKNTGNKSFYYNPGLMERAEAILLFCVMMVAPAWAFNWLAWLYTALVMLTTVLRVSRFIRIDLAYPG